MTNNHVCVYDELHKTGKNESNMKYGKIHEKERNE